MSDVTPERINIQQPEVAYRAAVSEATFSRVGAGINFINYFQHDRKEFFINGPYQTNTAIDGAHLFLYDAEIIGAAMFNIIAGSGGTTTMDIRRYTASGVGGSSIFTTLPSIDASAGNVSFVAVSLSPSLVILENPAGTVVPVFSVTNVNAGDLIVTDITTVQTGGPQNCGLILFHRPR